MEYLWLKPQTGVDGNITLGWETCECQVRESRVDPSYTVKAFAASSYFLAFREADREVERCVGP